MECSVSGPENASILGNASANSVQHTLGLCISHISSIKAIEKVENGKKREQRNIHLPVNASMHGSFVDRLEAIVSLDT